ncbi:hypothetical protein UFOVP826_11 [uncultured Caudovirales phage]|uniref:Uncharacterized protein n=1 Tax=uncultured Caudovirales phage TaxID=2100421 RepID=A0A6J5P2R3_9CAUD|nr:hypothetical protein UFOVP826_11 [uncultured Caudovirales phage]
MTHTPTPWQVHESSPNSPLQIIGNVDYSNDGTYVDADVVADMGCLKCDTANAAFIVTACNAHDALVAVLKRALRNIPAGPSALRFDMEAAMKLAGVEVAE